MYEKRIKPKSYKVNLVFPKRVPRGFYTKYADLRGVSRKALNDWKVRGVTLESVIKYDLWEYAVPSKELVEAMEKLGYRREL